MAIFKSGWKYSGVHYGDNQELVMMIFRGIRSLCSEVSVENFQGYMMEDIKGLVIGIIRDK